ncbi:hypothetical protein CWE09_10910 [Aliidiomarina minuta]|uniref:Uncharacterized protein n=1 Tax=Aliidiomarina minuta TaxID=880057 RepID=A0A432W4L4_9GAMM|nr:hypothetical protein [Aliidiomarina minuta]RUO24374.1 hypothetical protein CWE09_10910 [Aliidiomarina minuta]
MTDTPQVELAKLHEEFPILNDLEGTLIFRINEGESKPEKMVWNLDAMFQRHLARLGITERLQHFLAYLVRYQEGSSCEGKIEFERGRFRVSF